MPCTIANNQNQEPVPSLNAKAFNLDPVISGYEKELISLQKKNTELDIIIAQLKKEVDAYKSSTSWKLTKPIRKLSQLNTSRHRLTLFFKHYRYTYPGFSGFTRLLYKLAHAIITGGISKLRDSIIISEHCMLARSLFNKSLRCDNSKILEISWLKKFQRSGLVIKPTLVFDHNGGGGANVYTHALVKDIITDNGSTLRIYPSDQSWFIQWIGKDNQILFTTLHIEELFNVLSVSNSANIIINSLYGHPDITVSSSHIIELTQQLSAKLDFKIHDFNALCPSPHLMDSEGRYCGVPKDTDVCRKCLNKNQTWYHSWYPDKNKAIDILQWRKPFYDLLTIADTITFFDPSSIEIMRKALDIEGIKIKVIPHACDYFKCNIKMDLSGPLHIGCIGNLSPIKGSDVIKDLHDYIKNQNMNIPITIVGSSVLDSHSGINVYGNYEQNELPAIISKKEINVIFMASIIPETFSYSISEAIKMELPVVAFDIGAQGNRIKQYKFGRVISLNSSPKQILTAIQTVLKFAQEYKN